MPGGSLSPPHEAACAKLRIRFLYCHGTGCCGSASGKPQRQAFPRSRCVLRIASCGTVTYSTLINSTQPWRPVRGYGCPRTPRRISIPVSFLRCTDAKPPGVGREPPMTTNRRIGISECSLMIATTLTFYNVPCSMGVWSLWHCHLQKVSIDGEGG
jgi:hypothetical protein